MLASLFLRSSYTDVCEGNNLMQKKKVEDQVFDVNMAQSAHIMELNTVWEDALPLGSKLIYKKNTIIPHIEQQGVYYIKKGRVRLSYISPSGQERIALIYDTHSIFNEARVFAGYDPAGCFKCATDVELYLFPKNLLTKTEFIIKYPEIVKNLLFTMGAKILLHYSFLAEMGTGSSMAQICKFILNLSARNDNLFTFPANMTQQEICDLFGMHRATLARNLKRLKEMGAISHFTMRKVVIIDYNLLLTLSK